VGRVVIGSAGACGICLDCCVEIVGSPKPGREGITERVEDFGVTGRMRPDVRAGAESSPGV